MHAFSWTQADGMTDLGTLGAARTSSAVNVNAAGQVVGISEGHSFSWTKAGGMVDLGTRGGPLDEDYGGSSERRGTGRRLEQHRVRGAARLLLDEDRRHGQPRHPRQHAQPGASRQRCRAGRRLGLPGKGTAPRLLLDSRRGHDRHRHAPPRRFREPGRSRNQAGQVVGYGTLGPFGGAAHAFSWTKAGGIVELDQDEGHVSVAVGVNDAGQIVGRTYYATDKPLATSWTSGGGTAYLGDGSALAVNSSGEIAGVTPTEGLTSRATLWVKVTVPSAPPAVSATAGDGNALVTFDTPLSDGGSPIAYYTATASPGGLSASGTSSPITVGGLTNQTNYTFTVTGTNGAGAGPPVGAVRGRRPDWFRARAPRTAGR